MNKNMYSKVFMWMFVGLLITFGSGMLISYVPSLTELVYSSSNYVIVFILQIGICIALGFFLHKMSPAVAKVCYLLYTFLTGMTFASIFMIFELTSIVVIFLISAITFLVFAVIGETTKADLTKLGTYLFMALFAIIILEIVNVFVMNSTLDLLSCIIGIVVFLGYTAYDMQKIKYLSIDGVEDDKMAIFGAFELYLDFINLFLRLLELFGKSRD